jgi:peptidoglycan/xylan/chitin deacetylase (PgdA/CDA1 family)
MAPWIPILMYHRVVPVGRSAVVPANSISAAAFEAQMSWLSRRGYCTVTLDELVEMLGGARLAEKAGRNLMLLTFDDGYEDNFHCAMPILQRYGYVATIFLVASAIGGGNCFDAAYTTERVGMLSAKDIHSMRHVGFRFGSHSWSHPDSLPDLNDGDLTHELVASKIELETLLQEPVLHFSYPHTRVSERVEAAVAAAGYVAACSGVGTHFSRYRLDRVETAASGWRAEVEIGIRKLKYSVASFTRRSPGDALASP